MHYSYKIESHQISQLPNYKLDLLGSAREEKHLQQLTMPYHLTLTSSSVYQLSHHRTALFLLITMSLKLPLVQKSDVKQQFTTTTFLAYYHILLDFDST